MLARNKISLLLFILTLTYPSFSDSKFGGERHFVTIGSYTGFIIEPPDSVKVTSNPWAWYAPNIGDTPGASNVWLLERLTSKGFWIAGINVGESYGAPYGRKIFSQFYDTLRARYALSPKAVLMPQSRGGLQLYNWAADSGNTVKVDKIAGIYPVGDLRSYPGLTTASTAYQMTVQQLTDSLTFHNPIDRLQPLFEAGIKIFHIHGDNDAIVPLNKNSQVIYDRYTAFGGSMNLVVVPGAGQQEIPAFSQSQAMLDFILNTDITTSSVLTQPRASMLSMLSVAANPFNSVCSIAFYLPNSGHISLGVFDLAGKHIKTIVSERLLAGRHKAY